MSEQTKATSLTSSTASKTHSSSPAAAADAAHSTRGSHSRLATESNHTDAPRAGALPANAEPESSKPVQVGRISGGVALGVSGGGAGGPAEKTIAPPATEAAQGRDLLVWKANLAHDLKRTSVASELAVFDGELRVVVWPNEQRRTLDSNIACNQKPNRSAFNTKSQLPKGAWWLLTLEAAAQQRQLHAGSERNGAAVITSCKNASESDKFAEMVFGPREV